MKSLRLGRKNRGKDRMLTVSGKAKCIASVKLVGVDCG